MRQPAKKNNLRAALFILASLCAAQQNVHAELNPQGLMANALASDLFGPVQIEARNSRVQLLVNGEPVDDKAVVLVPSGDSMNVQAIHQFISSAEDAPKSSADLQDANTQPEPGGLLRQTRYQEVVWKARETDLLASRPDSTVTWVAGQKDGSPSELTAQMAEMRVNRMANLMNESIEPVAAPLSAASASVNFLPAIPYDRTGDGLIMGVNIGIYPNEASPRAPGVVANNQALYTPPTGFYRLDASTRDLKITQQLTLNDLCPAVLPGAAPEMRLVALSPRLITFIKAFEKKLETAKSPLRNVVILRGYVTPTERLRLEAQGERLAEFSRFIYGDAVALILTNSQDARTMGDFNSDGTVGVEDAQGAAALAKEVMDELRTYGALGAHRSFTGKVAGEGSPFVHIDLRGTFLALRDE